MALVALPAAAFLTFGGVWAANAASTPSPASGTSAVSGATTVGGNHDASRVRDRDCTCDQQDQARDRDRDRDRDCAAHGLMHRDGGRHDQHRQMHHDDE